MHTVQSVHSTAASRQQSPTRSSHQGHQSHTCKARDKARRLAILSADNHPAAFESCPAARDFVGAATAVSKLLGWCHRVLMGSVVAEDASNSCGCKRPCCWRLCCWWQGVSRMGARPDCARLHPFQSAAVRGGEQEGGIGEGSRWSEGLGIELLQWQ